MNFVKKKRKNRHFLQNIKVNIRDPEISPEDLQLHSQQIFILYSRLTYHVLKAFAITDFEKQELNDFFGYSYND